MKIFNCYGQELLDEHPLVAKESYYKYGTKEINWESEFGDSKGFDTRNKEENGLHTIKIELPHDTILIRYGKERNGFFTAPDGSKYENLGLPYKKETIQFHKYRVNADSISVFCIVEKGKVAPIFDSPGGAIQYYHEDNSVLELVRSKILERII